MVPEHSGNPLSRPPNERYQGLLYTLHYNHFCANKLATVMAKTGLYACFDFKGIIGLYRIGSVLGVMRGLNRIKHDF